MTVHLASVGLTFFLLTAQGLGVAAVSIVDDDGRRERRTHPRPCLLGSPDAVQTAGVYLISTSGHEGWLASDDSPLHVGELLRIYDSDGTQIDVQVERTIDTFFGAVRVLASERDPARGHGPMV